MGKISLRRMIQISSEYPHVDLIWSFKPILLFTQILGINLKVSERDSKFRRYGFLFWGILTSLFLLWVGGKWTYLMLVQHVWTHSFPLKLIAMIILHGILNILFGVAILKNISNNDSFWEKLQEIERVFCFSTQFLVKIRKSFMALIAFGCLLVKLFDITSKSFDEIFQSSQVPYDFVVNSIRPFIYKIAFMYDTLWMILFICVTRFASMSIQTMIENVQYHLYTPDGAIYHRISMWKKSYYLILEFIEEINEILGLVLVTIYGRTFLKIPFTLSTVQKELSDGEESTIILMKIGKVISSLILMSLSISEAEKMKQKVIFVISKYSIINQ